jgi:hypothetical protein
MSNSEGFSGLLDESSLENLQLDKIYDSQHFEFEQSIWYL